MTRFVTRSQHQSRTFRGTLFCVGLLQACAPSPAQQHSDTEDSQVFGEQCVVREVSRERLVVEGSRQLYIEPLVLEANGQGDILLAGRFNHLFEQTPEGGWGFAERDSILGAVIPRTGSARIVPSPIPTKLIGGVRATAREDGAWDIVFAEVKPQTEDFRSDTVARLWYGVLDGTRWTLLEKLPLPPKNVLYAHNRQSAD